MILFRIIFNMLLALAVASSTSLDYKRYDKPVIDVENIIWSIVYYVFMPIIFYYYAKHVRQAIADGSLLRVKLALCCGADINGRNYAGLTPLHTATSYQEFDIMRYLLHEGAHIHVVDNQRRNLLELAIQENRKDMFLCLLLHGAVADRTISQDMRSIITPFLDYRVNRMIQNKVAFYNLFTSENLKNITYSEKQHDLIGFALFKNDQEGIRYCINKNIFSYEDVFMAIAENQQHTKFLSRYLEHMELESWNPRDAYYYAKAKGNSRFTNAIKNYACIFERLQAISLRKNLGEVAVIKKILSYIDFN